MSSELLASKVVIIEEEPRIRQLQGVATNILGMIGVTEKGPIGTRTRVTSFEEWVNIFGADILDGDASHAVRGFFQNGGQVLDFVRTVHYTNPDNPATKTSVAATLNLQTAATAPSSGLVTGSAVEPFDLEPGDDLDIAVDGGAPATATFNATAAEEESGNAETFALADSDTLTVKIDQGSVQTITFLTAEFADIANATAEEVAAVINAKIVGATAVVTTAGTKVTIRSDTRGTGSYVEITGGTANAIGKLNFPTAEIQGTGNVANIDAVTVAEAKTIIEAAVAGVTVSNVSGAVRITSNTTGAASSVQVQASSTADDEFGFDNAVHSGGTGAAVNTLKVDGKYDGTYANDITIKITAATSGDAEEFNLCVLDGGLLVEVFPNLTMDSAATNYVETIVNDTDTGSRYIAVTDLAASGTATERKPATGTLGPLAGGNDGLAGLADTDFIGSEAGPTGIRVLDSSLDLSLLAIPDRPTSAVHNAMVTYCEDTRDGSVFAVLDPPAGQDASAIITYVETTASLLNLTEHAAIYWPQVKVLNPNEVVFGTAADLVVPPSGHIAGVMARNDARKPGGVYDQPAGVERGILRGVVGFETDDVLLERIRDLVFPKRINPLTTAPGLPLYIDGARTLKGNGNFPSVGERRGVIFIQQTLKNGLQFARHANNTPALRAQVERIIQAFLLSQFNVGAFRGSTPSSSFFVDVGEGLNPPSEVFAGKLNVRIGLATNKPAEFIILRFSQDTRELEEELAAAGL